MKYPIKSITGKLIAEIDVEGPDDQLKRLAVEYRAALTALAKDKGINLPPRGESK